METILFILSSPQLILTSILCLILGSLSFLSAINLCGIKGFGISFFKYLLTFISIESLSNLFMIVLAPTEFLKHSMLFSSIQIVMWLLLSWIIFYEAKWVLTKYKSVMDNRRPKVNLIKNNFTELKRT